MRSCLNSVLSEAEIEQGGLKMAFAPSSLRLVCANVVFQMAPWAQSAHVMLDSEVEPRVPDLLVCDPARFSQVAVNLVSNSLKHVSACSGRIRLRVRLLELFSSSGGPAQVASRGALVPSSAFADLKGHELTGETAIVRLEVEDNGRGVSLEAQGRLFKPFVMVGSPGGAHRHASSTANDGSADRVEGQGAKGPASSGLGLSIVSDIVSAHGGRVGVVSAPDRGATFWAEFPLLVARKVSARAPSSAGGTPRSATIPGSPVITAASRAHARASLRDDAATATGASSATLAASPAEEGGHTRLRIRAPTPTAARITPPGASLLASATHSSSASDSSRLGSSPVARLGRSPLAPAAREAVNGHGSATVQKREKALTDQPVCATSAPLLAASVAVGSAAADAAASSTAPLRILVVDDVHSNRKLLMRVLGAKWPRGQVVFEEAEDGAEAVALVDESLNLPCGESVEDATADVPATDGAGVGLGSGAQQQQLYDVILMDAQMPVCDGYRATQMIRDLTDGLPPWRRPVIIGVTGNALASDTDHFKHVGADDVAIKPVAAGQLSALIRMLIAVHRGDQPHMQIAGDQPGSRSEAGLLRSCS